MLAILNRRVFVSAELVRQGYAQADRYPPDTAQAGYFESLQAGAPTPICAIAQATAPPPSGSGAPASCTCSGPDLDCGDLGTHAAA